MSHREIKEELTCPICMELFRQPRRLPCGHSYCHVCIKAMLDRRAEESGLYLNYSRPLICPECREEINVDFVKGIEGIPPDFKLTKLVDLFQFMKGNNDSDSGDEIQPFKSVPCAVITEPSRTDTTAAAASVSLPPVATSPSEETRAPLFFQPTEPTSSSASPASQPLRENNTGTGQPEQNRNPSNSPTLTLQPTSSTINPASSTNSHNLNQTNHQLREVTAQTVSTAEAPGVDTGINFSPLLQQDENRQVLQQSDSHANQQTQSNTVSLNSPSGTTSDNQNNLQTGLVTQSTRVSESNNSKRLSQSLDDVNVRREGSFVRDYNKDGNDDRQVVSNSNDNSHVDELSSDLGAVGGVSRQSQPAPKRNSVRNSQEVSGNLTSNVVSSSDTLILHDRFDSNGGNDQVNIERRNENVDDVVSFPLSSSQRPRNLSQSSVSLPTDVKENVPNGQQTVPPIGVFSSESDRISRARSVPTETGEDRERTEVKQKSRKERRREQSLSSDSDSSSDFFRRGRRREGKKSTRKQKRWLMTRFLRSVIFSDSSSTDYSDDENKETFGSESRLNNRVRASDTSDAIRKLSLNDNQQSRIASDRLREGNLNQNRSGKDTVRASVNSSRPWDSREGQDSKGRVNSGRKGPGQVQACYLSLDSDTQPKEPASLGATSTSSQTNPKEKFNSSSSLTAGQVNLSFDSKTASLPALNTHGGATVLQDNTHSKQVAWGSAVSATRSRAVREEPRNLPRAQTTDLTLPSYYDNFNGHISPSSDNAGRTRYDNLATRPHRSISAEFVDADAVRCDNILVRDPSFDPCNQTDRLEHGQRRGFSGLRSPDPLSHQGRTLYDNIDDCDLVLEGGLPISPRIPRRHVQERNVITEIEDLKTGYEHMARNGSSSLRESMNTDLGSIEHMGELDLESRQAVSTQDSSLSYGCYSHDNQNQSANRHEGSSQRDEICAQMSRDNPSSYDNLTNRSLPNSFTNHNLPADRDTANFRRSEMANDRVTVTHPPRTGEELNSQSSDIATDPNLVSEYPPPLDHERECSDEGLDFVENYFDPNNDQSRRRNMSLENLAPAAVAMETAETSQNERVAEMDLPGASSSSSVSAARGSDQSNLSSHSSGNKDTAKKKETSSDNEDYDDEDDDGSHSGTSMLQNKKKPRSRLKKFLTSLLSLSSSSEDEDNYDTRTSSSKSSDW